MALEVIWTKNAQEQLTEMIAHLEASGNESLLRRFSQQLKSWDSSKTILSYTKSLINQKVPVVA